MLDVLRTKTQTPGGRLFLGLMFGLLALTFFISFGPSGRVFDRVKSNDYAAKVNGEQISRIDFERYYYRQVRQFGQLDPAMLDRILPRGRVLDELIKDRLVAEQAQGEGIDVSDRELREVIVKDPSFQEDGKFSGERYKLVVERSLGMTVDLYEDELRHQLRVQKVGALLRENAKVTDAELKRAYAEENDKVDLRFVRFSPAFYTAGVAVSDAEVQALIKDHFDQVQAAYTKQASLYHSAKQVQVRHLLIKTPQGSAANNAGADAVAKSRLAKLKESLEKGGDFGAIAKSQSQAADATAGGELGLVRAGSKFFDPALEAAALSLEEGKISDPVRTQQGWELVQAEKVVPAADHPLDEVKASVAHDVIVKDRAIAKAEEAARAAQAQLSLGKSLAALYPPVAAPDGAGAAVPAPEHPVSDTTGAFARSAMGFLPKVGPAAELQKVAFDAAKPGPLAGPTRLGDAFVVVELVSHERGDAATFEKNKADLRENQLRRTEVQLMQSLRAMLRSKAVVEINGAVLGPTQQNEG